MKARRYHKRVIKGRPKRIKHKAGGIAGKRSKFKLQLRRG